MPAAPAKLTVVTPAASGAPASLIGTWDGPRGRMRVDANGTVFAEGQQLRWAIEGDMVVLTGPRGSVRIGYSLDGDRVRFIANGQTESFTRVDLDDPMQTIAGAWVAAEHP
jgi:hypothetical protein